MEEIEKRDRVKTGRGNLHAHELYYFEEYILAIHAGVSGNYEPIKNLFKMLIEKSIS